MSTRINSVRDALMSALIAVDIDTTWRCLTEHWVVVMDTTAIQEKRTSLPLPRCEQKNLEKKKKREKQHSAGKHSTGRLCDAGRRSSAMGITFEIPFGEKPPPRTEEAHRI